MPHHPSVDVLVVLRTEESVRTTSSEQNMPQPPSPWVSTVSSMCERVIVTLPEQKIPEQRPPVLVAVVAEMTVSVSVTSLEQKIAEQTLDAVALVPEIVEFVTVVFLLQKIPQTPAPTKVVSVMVEFATVV